MVHEIRRDFQPEVADHGPHAPLLSQWIPEHRHDGVFEPGEQTVHNDSQEVDHLAEEVRSLGLFAVEQLSNSVSQAGKVCQMYHAGSSPEIPKARLENSWDEFGQQEAHEIGVFHGPVEMFNMLAHFFFPRNESLLPTTEKVIKQLVRSPFTMTTEHSAIVENALSIELRIGVAGSIIAGRNQEEV